MYALKNFTEHPQRSFLINDLNNWVPGGGGGEHSEFQVTEMMKGFFGHLFSVPRVMSAY